MSYEPEALPPDFAEAFARARDEFGRLGSSVMFFPTIGSTNDIASRLAEDSGHEGAIVIADQQTAGRGRRGRTWFSPPTSGLYVSIVLDPGRARSDRDRVASLLTLAAGVALAEAVERATGLTADIKWPNDLVVGRRKVAGILAEAVTGDRRDKVARVVLGYGINVTTSAYPPEIAERATSLDTELGRAVDRATLCAETVKAIARRYDDLLEGRFDAILDAWRSRAPANRGARVEWQTPGGRSAGVTAGVDDWGALLVSTDARIERLVAGEILWL
jgi:BirA family biotin operon repressor/biotin-[acetyl-CoA-carboxylase] ligase